MNGEGSSFNINVSTKAVQVKSFSYIGKAQQPDSPVQYHLLPYHLMDVAAVGYRILQTHPSLADDLADLLEVTREELISMTVFGLLIHDLGKMTASFQSLFREQGYSLISLAAGVSYDASRARHDQLGRDVWRQVELPESWGEGRAQKRLRRLMTPFLGIFWGHHGKPVHNQDSMLDTASLTTEDVSAANEWIHEALSLVGAGLPVERFDDPDFRENLKRASWLLAGFSTYCDWVGSDSSVFEYLDSDLPVSEYWSEYALPRADRAIAKTEVFEPITVSKFSGFQSFYGFPPSPLQHLVSEIQVTDSPQLFIVEDLTGSGKTEAALALTHRLLEAGAGDGFYVALPTMATSNAMFSRVGGYYSRMLQADKGAPSIVLAHGSRDMNQEFQEARLGAGQREPTYQRDESTASAHCSEWLSDSRKKALLAPVGVGTIDQVLLSVLPKKHQSLRVLGLYRKVLVIDEIHAADTYMLKLLESVLALHASQGGSVVMLTATLSHQQRQDLVNAWQSANRLPATDRQAIEKDDFPLLTCVNHEGRVAEHPVEVRPGTEKAIAVAFVHTQDECLGCVVEAVEKNQCVVWIRNSVDEAIEAYEQVRKKLKEPDKALLFHSRFMLADRMDKEQWVLSHLGKHSDAESRAGRVLIATQVFQESLDADADVMISDLCLIDDLIQRAGRLHRHVRDQDGNPLDPKKPDQRTPPELIVHAPVWQEEPDETWLKKHSVNTQFVYQTPGRIWLTMDYLLRAGEIKLPEESRKMIEHVYRPDAPIPEALLAAEIELAGKDRADSSQAKFNRLNLDAGYSMDSSLVWSDDNVELGTRLGEEAHEVLLLTRDDTGYRPCVENQRHSVELSTVKLSNKKLLRALTELPEDEREQFTKAYPRSKFMKLCLLESQQDSQYSSEMGLSLR